MQTREPLSDILQETFKWAGLDPIPERASGPQYPSPNRTLLPKAIQENIAWEEHRQTLG